MPIGYENKRLKSIRDRDTYSLAAQAGKLSIATALKNVSDTYDQLLANVDEGQRRGDCSEAIRDIDHIILRLQAIRTAIGPKAKTAPGLWQIMDKDQRLEFLAPFRGCSSFSTEPSFYCLPRQLQRQFLKRYFPSIAPKAAPEGEPHA